MVDRGGGSLEYLPEKMAALKPGRDRADFPPQPPTDIFSSGTASLAGEKSRKRPLNHLVFQP
jgi:hypothetical protein